VKGSVIALDEPKSALRLLDQARLLGTGTLVEEAALRRSVALAATLGDAGRFMLASTQYVDRYLRSPYASQFADTFVSGVITLHASLNQETLGDITSMMDAEQEKVVYLRIARRAAIEGLNDLSAFASAKAEAGDAMDMGSDDPRALLYASLASVTSANIEDIRAKLKKIDRKQLSESDRMLLDAVGTIADEVTDPPSAANIPEEKPATLASQADALPAAENDPGVDAAAMPEDGPEKAGPTPVGPVVRQAIAANAPALAADSPEASMDPADLLVVETRKKLDAIDRMLGDATQ
jgi:chemotaxis protein MotC